MNKRYSSSSVDMGEKPPVTPGFENINRYWDEKHSIYAAKILPGEFFVSLHGELITTVLGSCISACIRDPRTGIGGMNHFMLPDNLNNIAGSWKDTPVTMELRYGNVAMERLINFILAAGAKKPSLEIKLFGGARLLNMMTDIGGKNIEFVKKYLATEQLNIMAEDVGGIRPRKVQYFPSTGRVRIKLLNSMHNDTLDNRERAYLDSIKRQRIAGSIDLFS